MKRRKKASSYSRRRRGIRTRKNEMAHKNALLRNLIGMVQRPTEIFAGVKIPLVRRFA
jgi:hypothetical protein